MNRLKSKAGSFKRAVASILKNNPNRYLRYIKGVIHVGANTGQGRDLYAKHNLQVMWVEPIPEVFLELQDNINGYASQHALNYLVTDTDHKSYDFHISNNAGASSSILQLDMHKDIWPHVDFIETITLESFTLDTVLAREKIDIDIYDGLVLDTQGSELMVLQGAVRNLERFKFIQVEVPDFESYVGCCQRKDIDSFLEPAGFREFSRVKFAEHSGGGSYYDIVYKKVL